jgi:hypothetical protein
MPRTARADVGGIIYHVLNRGNARRQIFFKDGDYQAFLLLHAYADSYAHTYDSINGFEYAYGPPLGHLFNGHWPDIIGNDIGKYQNYVLNLYQALGGKNPGTNQYLKDLLTFAATLPFYPILDFASEQYGALRSSLDMERLARQELGYSEKYKPGLPLAAPIEKRLDPTLKRPDKEEVRSLFPLIDDAKYGAWVELLVGALPVTNAYIDEFAFSFALFGVV